VTVNKPSVMAPMLDPVNLRNQRDNFRVLSDYIRLMVRNEWNRMLVEQRRLETDKSDTTHQHPASDIISGTFADARIAGSNVVQHEALLDHDALLNYVLAQHRIINDSGTSATELWSANKIDGSFQPRATSADSVTANSGGGQGGSPQTADFIHIAIVAAAGDSVTLPNVQTYSFSTITNDGANSADIFPFLGEEINGTGVNNAVALASGARAWLMYLTSGNWRMVTL